MLKSDKVTARDIKEFFMRGRKVKTPDGLGIFLEISAHKIGGWVLTDEGRGGMKCYTMQVLVDLNIASTR